MNVKESGYTKDELLDIVDKYLAEPSRRWDFIEEKGDGMYVYDEEGNAYLDFFGGIAVKTVPETAIRRLQKQLPRSVKK